MIDVLYTSQGHPRVELPIVAGKVILLDAFRKVGSNNPKSAPEGSAKSGASLVGSYAASDSALRV